MSAAGVEAGDRIVRVGVSSVDSWWDLVREIESRPGQRVELTLSREGREHYAAVKRAQLFASENARPLQTQLATLATSLGRTSSDGATRDRRGAIG